MTSAMSPVADCLHLHPQCLQQMVQQQVLLVAFVRRMVLLQVQQILLVAFAHLPHTCARPFDKGQIEERM